MSPFALCADGARRSPMTAARARWLLFGFALLLLPIPMFGPFEALVPPVRYWMLFGAAAAIGIVEGAAGPVPGILALLGAFALFSTLVAFAFAWVGAGLIVRPPLPGVRAILCAALAVWLVLALLFDVFVTPFGPVQRTNLFGILS